MSTWRYSILSETLLQVLEPLLGDGVEEEKHFSADSPAAVPKGHVGPLTVSCCVTMFGGVNSQSAGVREGRELAKDHHVKFCPCELVTLTPVVLNTLHSECAAAWPISQVTATTISEKSLN